MPTLQDGMPETNINKLTRWIGVDIKAMKFWCERRREEGLCLARVLVKRSQQARVRKINVVQMRTGCG